MSTSVGEKVGQWESAETSSHEKGIDPPPQIRERIITESERKKELYNFNNVQSNHQSYKTRKFMASNIHLLYRLLKRKLKLFALEY